MLPMRDTCNHYFIQKVLFNVSVRFRQIATDSSLWKGGIKVFTKPDFRELDFIIRECLNSETTSMEIWIKPPPLRTVTLPNRYLIDLVKFPKLKMVDIWGGREKDIPAPWSLKEGSRKYKVTLTRD